MSSGEWQIMIYTLCFATFIWVLVVSFTTIKEDKKIYKDSDWVIDIVNGKPVKKEVR